VQTAHFLHQGNDTFAKLGVKPGMNVCDMGCGNGFYTVKMAKMAGDKGHVYAVDIQPEMLEKLVKQTGWSPSKVVREGLRLLASCYPGNGPRKIIGLGKFASGIPDLGSNKEHMKGFGK